MLQLPGYLDESNHGLINAAVRPCAYLNARALVVLGGKNGLVFMTVEKQVE